MASPRIRVLFCAACSLLLCPTPALAAVGPGSPPLQVVARVVELPRAPRCQQNEVRVTVLYRVERVLQGTLAAETIHVVHRCPEVPRGPSKFGRGDAPRIRLGHRHRLELRPAETLSSSVVDPFSDDDTPRYLPLRTDPAPELPRIVVVVQGGAGSSQKLSFDREEVTLGRAADADVRLDGPLLAVQQLRLVRTGERITVHNLNPAAGIRINERPLILPHKITYQDRIRVGRYTVRVALFLNPKDDD